VGTLGHSNVLSIGESLHIGDQKTGELGIEDVFGKRSGEWQTGQNPGFFY